MMGSTRTLALGLALALAAPPARAQPAEGPELDAGQWARSLVELGDRRSEARDHVDAARLYFDAYDRLAADATWKQRIGALHGPLEKGLNAAGEAARADPAHAWTLCEADFRALVHAQRLIEAEALTREAAATLRDVRGRLAVRISEAGATCPGGQVVPAALAERLVPTPAAGLGATWFRIVRPGALAHATRSVVIPLPRDGQPLARRNPGRMWTHLGVGLMAGGLMALGLGLTLSGLDDGPSEVGPAMAMVAGSGMLVAGFPLLIVGDKRRRQPDLALGPRGLGLAGAF